MKSIYINSKGGLGFQFALSHVCKELKEKYDEVAILSPYWDVFECNPYVDIVYKPQEVRDFVMDAKSKDARLIVERLYDTEDFLYKKVSYADAWRKITGLPVRNKSASDTKTVIEPLPRYNLESFKNQIIEQIHKDGYEDYILCQFWGSQSPLIQVPMKVENGKQIPDWSQVPYNYDEEPLKRHYPIDLASKFVQLYKEKYPKTAVILYSLPNEPNIDGTYKFTVPYLTYHLLAKEAKGIISIDSSLQHLSAGLCKTVVLWAHSISADNEKKTIGMNSFGYEYNSNIVQDCRRDDIFYFSDLGPSGAAVRYIKPEKLLELVEKCFESETPVNYIYSREDRDYVEVKDE